MAFDVTILGGPVPFTTRRGRALQTSAIVGRRSTNGQSILVAGLPAVLIFAVLALGSFDPWAIAILEIACALLLLFWTWSQISSGVLQLRPNPLYAPAALFGLIIVVQIVLRLSAYPHATREELWKYVAYGILLLLASQCQRVSANRLLTILAAFGFVVALFALVQDLTYNDKIYWFWPSVSTSFGPYANYNHYAGLMEMLTPIPLALALTDGKKSHERLLWAIAGILMAATIFICGSGGGMISFAIELLFLGGFVIARRRRRTAWVLFAACLLSGALSLWIDDGRMLRKLEGLGKPLANADVTTRLTITRNSLKMVHDRPIAGWGLGLFPIVYPQYRSFSTDLLVNEAHNDYVQALVETGVLGFSCVIWFIVNLYRSAIHKLTAHSRGAVGRTLGPLVGCTGILVHSFSDFNLHIPANAALFFVLCGMASASMERVGASG